MAEEADRRIGVISKEFAQAVLGPDAVLPAADAFDAASRELDANFQDEIKTAAQLQELHLVRETADLIEADFNNRGIALPNVFVVYTAGFEAPNDATEIAPYGTGPLQNLLHADIGGHMGVAGALKIDNTHTAMIFNGRAHAYSGVGDKFGEMLYGRPLNVIKELMRRQRERGKQCAVILTYLTGADETTELQKGDIGVAVSYTERAGGRGVLAAGAGPHDIWDKVEGIRFQPKLRRGSDTVLAKKLKWFADIFAIKVGAVAAVGTADTPKFQDPMDQADGQVLFERARAKLDTLAVETLGEGSKASLLFDMAVAFDVNMLRMLQLREQLDGHEKYGEQEFPLLILGLPTDIVGVESEDVGHDAVVEEAKKHGGDNGELVRALIEEISKTIDQTHPLAIPPSWVFPKFSIRGQFEVA